VTNESGVDVGSLTVRAYDAYYQNEIGSAVVTDSVWLLSIPADYIGWSVYLKLSADNYPSLEDTYRVETLLKNGQAGIELELEFVTGVAITGLDGVLQIGEATGTITAASTESGTKVWASSNSGAATINASSGVVTLSGAGDTTISYTAMAGNVLASNSVTITVYSAAATLNPTYTVFSDFVGEKTSPSNQNNITAKGGTAVFSITEGTAATIDNATGALTLVDSGQVTVELKIAESSGRIIWKGNSIVTLTKWTPAPVTDLAITADYQKVTLSWTKPAGPDAGRLTGYVISCGEAQIQIDNGNTVSREITGLSNGSEYRFGVKARYSGTVIATHESAEEFINGTPVNQSGITAIPPVIPDALIDLTGPESSVLWLNGTITASVDNYDNSITRINWYLDGVEVPGQTSALSLPACNYALGTHHLTVIATKNDDKSYSKTVDFTIVKE
jgi:hypothetical protein